MHQSAEAIRTFEAVLPQEVLGPLTDMEKRAAPQRLYLRGERGLLANGPRVSVVGSRRASRDGLEKARRITQFLVQRDVTVVSGLALGVDTVAHETAMSEGGRTIAVLGTGLDQYAVTGNRALQDRIGHDHLLVSQFPSDQPIQRSHFPQRNKTMALLSDATIIVEAGEDSGTRHQGWEAIKLGRPVLFPIRFLESTKASWPREMAEYGAFGFDAVSLARVLESLPYRSAEPLPF